MFVSWIVYAVALLALDAWVPGVEVGGIFWALLASAMLGLVNALVRPLLVVLTLPITVFTLGLFLFILNALMVWLVAFLVPGFSLASFGTACFVALVFWAIGVMLQPKKGVQC